VTLVTMELIAQIALGVIIGGLTIALLVTGFFVWNSRQRNKRLAVALFIAGAVIVVAHRARRRRIGNSPIPHTHKGNQLAEHYERWNGKAPQERCA
jgi:hypothetical protein